jgi:transcriptional regulator with XRE-family HTH domain
MHDVAPWQALGTELAHARHRTGHTQQQLAPRLGITQAAYSQFERGRTRPRPALLCPLALILGADIAHLTALAGYSLEQVLAVASSRP